MIKVQTKQLITGILLLRLSFLKIKILTLTKTSIYMRVKATPTVASSSTIRHIDVVFLRYLGKYFGRICFYRYHKNQKQDKRKPIVVVKSTMDDKNVANFSLSKTFSDFSVLV